MTGHQLTVAGSAPITMTSLELVEFINEQRKVGEPELTHANFLAKVPKVLGETSHLFECDLPDAYGRSRRGYRFPKREACLMAMSYSYELQAKVFDRMTALESQQALALPDFSDPVAAARAWADAKEGEQKAIAACDEAVRTKALIGSRREATAMATASAAKREADRLKHALGFSSRHATILQVEGATGGDYDFVPLRRWCNANEVTPEVVPDKRYPKGVKAWPAGAWMAVYGVSLPELFSCAEAT